MKRSHLLSALLQHANLPAGPTVAEAKADADAAWRERQQEIRQANLHYWRRDQNRLYS